MYDFGDDIEIDTPEQAPPTQWGLGSSVKGGNGAGGSLSRNSSRERRAATGTNGPSSGRGGKAESAAGSDDHNGRPRSPGTMEYSLIGDLDDSLTLSGSRALRQTLQRHQDQRGGPDGTTASSSHKTINANRNNGNNNNDNNNNVADANESCFAPSPVTTVAALHPNTLPTELESMLMASWELTSVGSASSSRRNSADWRRGRVRASEAGPQQLWGQTPAVTAAAAAPPAPESDPYFLDLMPMLLHVVGSDGNANAAGGGRARGVPAALLQEAQLYGLMPEDLALSVSECHGDDVVLCDANDNDNDAGRRRVEDGGFWVGSCQPSLPQLPQQQPQQQQKDQEERDADAAAAKEEEEAAGEEEEDQEVSLTESLDSSALDGFHQTPSNHRDTPQSAPAPATPSSTAAAAAAHRSEHSLFASVPAVAPVGQLARADSKSDRPAAQSGPGRPFHSERERSASPSATNNTSATPAGSADTKAPHDSPPVAPAPANVERRNSIPLHSSFKGRAAAAAAAVAVEQQRATPVTRLGVLVTTGAGEAEALSRSELFTETCVLPPASAAASASAALRSHTADELGERVADGYSVAAVCLHAAASCSASPGSRSSSAVIPGAAAAGDGPTCWTYAARPVLSRLFAALAEQPDPTAAEMSVCLLRFDTAQDLLRADQGSAGDGKLPAAGAAAVQNACRAVPLRLGSVPLVGATVVDGVAAHPVATAAQALAHLSDADARLRAMAAAGCLPSAAAPEAALVVVSVRVKRRLICGGDAILSALTLFSGSPAALGETLRLGLCPGAALLLRHCVGAASYAAVFARPAGMDAAEQQTALAVCEEVLNRVPAARAPRRGTVSALLAHVGGQRATLQRRLAEHQEKLRERQAALVEELKQLRAGTKSRSKRNAGLRNVYADRTHRSELLQCRRLRRADRSLRVIMHDFGSTARGATASFPPWYAMPYDDRASNEPGEYFRRRVAELGPEPPAGAGVADTQQQQQQRKRPNALDASKLGGAGEGGAEDSDGVADAEVDSDADALIINERGDTLPRRAVNPEESFPFPYRQQPPVIDVTERWVCEPARVNLFSGEYAAPAEGVAPLFAPDDGPGGALAAMRDAHYEPPLAVDGVPATPRAAVALLLEKGFPVNPAAAATAGRFEVEMDAVSKEGNSALVRDGEGNRYAFAADEVVVREHAAYRAGQPDLYAAGERVAEAALRFSNGYNAHLICLCGGAHGSMGMARVLRSPLWNVVLGVGDIFFASADDAAPPPPQRIRPRLEVRRGSAGSPVETLTCRRLFISVAQIMDSDYARDVLQAGGEDDATSATGDGGGRGKREKKGIGRVHADPAEGGEAAVPFESAWTPAGPVLRGVRYHAVRDRAHLQRLLRRVPPDVGRTGVGSTHLVVSLLAHQRRVPGGSGGTDASGAPPAATASSSSRRRASLESLGSVVAGVEPDTLLSAFTMVLTSDSAFLRAHAVPPLDVPPGSGANVLRPHYCHAAVCVADVPTADVRHAFPFLTRLLQVSLQSTTPFTHCRWSLTKCADYLQGRAAALRSAAVAATAVSPSSSPTAGSTRGSGGGSKGRRAGEETEPPSPTGPSAGAAVYAWQQVSRMSAIVRTLRYGEDDKSASADGVCGGGEDGCPLRGPCALTADGTTYCLTAPLAPVFGTRMPAKDTAAPAAPASPAPAPATPSAAVAPSRQRASTVAATSPDRSPPPAAPRPTPGRPFARSGGGANKSEAVSPSLTPALPPSRPHSGGDTAHGHLSAAAPLPPPMPSVPSAAHFGQQASARGGGGATPGNASARTSAVPAMPALCDAAASGFARPLQHPVAAAASADDVTGRSPAARSLQQLPAAVLARPPSPGALSAGDYRRGARNTTTTNGGRVMF